MKSVPAYVRKRTSRGTDGSPDGSGIEILSNVVCRIGPQYPHFIQETRYAVNPRSGLRSFTIFVIVSFFAAIFLISSTSKRDFGRRI
ncbi:uncharacterized protein OCT59_016588 [Rhizophagus irregularis]|uniref:uncharacterized protein n=1 Tax=Rhizophagus irregularis TaxID=588596 RepID=UPI0033268FA6|nr:hypothetical protein OCT59_016588 [Rhizophagus irregularis]